nr:PREDICTED: uncharacterized protein LOC108951419 isoform X3 [Musa acuminata subsp. malaccensis]
MTSSVYPGTQNRVHAVRKFACEEGYLLDYDGSFFLSSVCAGTGYSMLDGQRWLMAVRSAKSQSMFYTTVHPLEDSSTNSYQEN